MIEHSNRTKLKRLIVMIIVILSLLLKQNVLGIKFWLAAYQMMQSVFIHYSNVKLNSI